MASTFPLATVRWTALAAAALLGGCSLMPRYERPAAPVAAEWPAYTGAGTAPAATPVEGPAAAELPWQDFVTDPALRELIGLALQNNRDLRVAMLAVEQSQAQFRIRRADQFPTINVGVSGNRAASVDGDGAISSSYSGGLVIAPAWELDFFGRVSSLKEAALAQYLATEEGRKAAQISLVAAVSNAWLSLQTNDQLFALTQQTLATRESSLQLTQMRFDNGATSALDLRQAQSLAASARATLAQQRRLRAQDLNALTLLVGQPLPASLVPALPVLPAPEAAAAAPTAPAAPPPAADTAVSDTTTAPPPALFREVPAGLPSDLLTRRPDIRQAEQQLIAANANIGAARAAFFPRISLTAGIGSASSELSGLFKNGTWGWTAAPQALLPIFDAGRNRANLASAKSARAIAVAQYEKAIQSAFREVADALAGRETLGEQLAAQQAQAEAEAERFKLAELRYRNGVASFLDLLDAQRSLFASQQALALTRLAQQQNQVTLYKALGGGWGEGTPGAEPAATP